MDALTLDLTKLAALIVGPVVGILIAFGILALLEKRDREALRIAKIKQLYNAELDCIGEIEYRKRNGTVKVTFNDKLKNIDVVLTFEEFEEYKRRFNFRAE